MSAAFAAVDGSVAALIASPGLLAVLGCLTFFLFEYCWHELVHTYTYDLFRERLGFKLVWGCTCFVRRGGWAGACFCAYVSARLQYPFFYGVGVFPFAQPSCGAAHLSVAAASVCTTLFFAGWVFTRGASEYWLPDSPLTLLMAHTMVSISTDLQKHACKLGKTSFALGLVPMETLPGSRGRLLVSGFWGISRHINYAGEILQAFAIALPTLLACGSLLPLAYPAYYIALFIPRAIDDDKQCRVKYGPELWAAYVARVPFYILPGVW